MTTIRALLIFLLLAGAAPAAEWPVYPNGTNTPPDRLLWLNPGGGGLRTLCRGGIYDAKHPTLWMGKCTLRFPVNMVSQWHNLLTSAPQFFHLLDPFVGTSITPYALWHDGHGQPDSLWMGFWVQKGVGLEPGDSTDVIADQGSVVLIDCRHC